MLIVVEGIHSSGKSTLSEALARWLRERGERVVETSWNSSEVLGPHITRLKIDNRLRPTTMVLMEAADLAHRYERVLRPALDEGRVVVSDRYLYSTLVRGRLRGVEEGFIRRCFSFAPAPDLVLHVRSSGGTTLERRLSAGQSIGGHMAGEDFRPISDERAAFVELQERTEQLYGEVLPPGTVRLPEGATPAALHSLAAAEVDRVLRERRGTVAR
ncbi:dTMP kinase [Streptomyces sulphureus]|uniref:dTMP kinase n=1 Tax=Streptomyces sulphureus TaxID=47758 RepID=UPI000379438F|nr:hypothetical protein [Streptomyces sulphureus]